MAECLLTGATCNNAFRWLSSVNPCKSASSIDFSVARLSKNGTSLQIRVSSEKVSV